MHRNRIVTCSTFLILLHLTLVGTSQAIDHVQFKGQGASASFFNVDPSGCIATDVFVQFGESISKSPPDSGQPLRIATVFISKYDFCTGTQLISASPNGDAVLPDGAAQIDKHLNSARLNTTIDVFDYISNSLFNVEIHLTWTATGEPPSRSNGHFHFRSPGFIVNSHSSSVSRAAEASGSVSFGSVNLTPEPTMSAQFESAMIGELIIDHR